MSISIVVIENEPHKIIFKRVWMRAQTSTHTTHEWTTKIMTAFRNGKKMWVNSVGYWINSQSKECVYGMQWLTSFMDFKYRSKERKKNKYIEVSFFRCLTKNSYASFMRFIFEFIQATLIFDFEGVVCARCASFFLFCPISIGLWLLQFLIISFLVKWVME